MKSKNMFQSVWEDNPTACIVLLMITLVFAVLAVSNIF